MTDERQVLRIEQSLAELQRLVGSARLHEQRVRATGVQLSRTTFRLLAELTDRGAVSVSRLASLMDVSQPTASRILAQLEEDGLVSRAGDPDDGRVVVYQASAKGRRAVQRMRDEMRTQMAASLAGLTDRRTREIADALDEIVERMRRQP